MPLSVIPPRWSPSSPSPTRYAPLNGVGSGKQPEVINRDDEQDASPPRNRRQGQRYIWFLVGLLSGVLTTNTAFLLLAEARSHPRFLPPSPATVKEFAPTMPLTTVVFEARRELFGRLGSAEGDAAWNALMPLGGRHHANGYVVIPNPQDYDLPPGVPAPELGLGDGIQRFSVSMYHQLHCLRMIRDSYWTLITAIEAGSLDAAKEVVQEQLGYEHALHCFAYLVQGVQCSADLSVEWPNIVNDDGSRNQTDGVGMLHRQCKNPEAVRAWTNGVMYKPPAAGGGDGMDEH